MADIIKQLGSMYTAKVKMFLAVGSMVVMAWFILSVFWGLPTLPHALTDPFIDHINWLITIFTTNKNKKM